MFQQYSSTFKSRHTLKWEKDIQKWENNPFRKGPDPFEEPVIGESSMMIKGRCVELFIRHNVQGCPSQTRAGGGGCASSTKKESHPEERTSASIRSSYAKRAHSCRARSRGAAVSPYSYA